MKSPVLRLSLQAGERIFALKDKDEIHYFGLRRAQAGDTGGDFEACRFFNLGTSATPLWMPSDYWPVPRQFYEDLTDSDDASTLLELAPELPEVGKLDVWSVDGADRVTHSMVDREKVRPKVKGWLFRVSTTGKTMDVFLVNGGLYVGGKVESTGSYIPARRLEYLKKSLLTPPLPGDWDKSVAGPICPECDAPGPHVSNQASGAELAYQCNTCRKEFAGSEAKQPRRAKNRG